MEYIRIKDLSTATEAELKAALEHNSKTFKLMSTKVESIRKVNAAAKDKGKKEHPEDEPLQSVSIVEPKSDIDEEFEEEVEFYYSEVKSLTSDNLEGSLERALPSRKHYDYEQILRRIQAEILKNCKEIRDFIASEKLSKADKEVLLEELALEQRKTAAISQQLSASPETYTETEQEENNLIFVPTSGGNIRVLDEIDRIDQAFYRRFEILFSSIKDGTFKGVKKLHGELVGLTEVKDRPSGARVAFMRLDKNTYAIISAFVKKCDNSNGYQKALANNYQSYKDVESSLIANLDNPEFMALHKEYETELFRKLNPTFSITSPVYKKVGE